MCSSFSGCSLGGTVSLLLSTVMYSVWWTKYAMLALAVKPAWLVEFLLVRAGGGRSISHQLFVAWGSVKNAGYAGMVVSNLS